ncbi:MAG: hypothetical protein KDA55_01370, partial [Planctomycetales bacterium]|nr:hypothetical protein [Planctomycetales bacterium]
MAATPATKVLDRNRVERSVHNSNHDGNVDGGDAAAHSSNAAPAARTPNKVRVHKPARTRNHNQPHTWDSRPRRP